MERATPGCRRISPARSRVSTIWWTEGGLTPKCRCRSASAGGRPSTRVLAADGPVAPEARDPLPHGRERGGAVSLAEGLPGERAGERRGAGEHPAADDAVDQGAQL